MKKYLAKMLSMALSASMAFTSVIPSYAAELPTEPTIEDTVNDLDSEDPLTEDNDTAPAEDGENPAEATETPAEDGEILAEDDEIPAEDEETFEEEEVDTDAELEEEEIDIEPVEEEENLLGEGSYLTVGQVEPTAITSVGNTAIADAWKTASGNDASDTMKAATNDYHIGVWYAALTGLDSGKTYYLVREYLDGSNNVLAADWGTYSEATEKFVFSSWGMNLQDASWHQIELKDAIKEVSADVAKVRFTLTETAPTGSGTLKAAKALNWPESIAADEDIAGIYASVSGISSYLWQKTLNRSGEAVSYNSNLAVGQVEPTAITSVGNAVIADAWETASGNDASDTMKAATNDYHIGAWYAALTGLDKDKTYYLVREYLNGDDVLAADWGTYSEATEKFVFSSWGMNLQDASWHQIELKDAIKEVSADVTKVRFTLTETEPTGSGTLKAAKALNWPESIAADADLSGIGIYGSVTVTDSIWQKTLDRSGEAVSYGSNYAVGQVEPTAITSEGNAVIADAWKAASGNDASDTMKAATNDYHIGVWYAALTGLDKNKTYYLVREYLNGDDVLAADWGTYSEATEKFVFSSWGMNLQDASWHQIELKDAIKDVSADVTNVRFTLTNSEPSGTGTLKAAQALNWPKTIAAGVDLSDIGIYKSVTVTNSIWQKTLERSGEAVYYGTNLTVGQVEPTATTADGNDEIADAWKAASGKKASGNMVAPTNDYHIGVWYAALTGLDPARTYYLVREYLDSNDKVLAVDWGKYSKVTEKFVFSSWGMNLQDTSYRQRELKDTIEEIETNAEKVRFTLTTTKPVGQVGSNLKTAIALGWPKIAEGQALADDTYGVYPSISTIAAEDIISRETVERKGNTVKYATGTLTEGQVEPTADTDDGNTKIAAAWKNASGEDPTDSMKSKTNDYHIGVWHASLTDLDAAKTYYLVREYLDSDGRVLAVDWGTYNDGEDKVTKKFVFSSWGMNLQDTSWRQRELKDTVAGITEDVAEVRFTLTTTEPTPSGTLKAAQALNWPKAIAAGGDITGNYAKSISAIDDVDIIDQKTVKRSGSAVKYATGTLSVGQVVPTATTATGNEAIAAAWLKASGKEPTDSMKSATNDYHIGAWYAALTDLDSTKTYYLVRKYLDSEGNVLAVDWGTYTGVTEKFVFSSWGMNLQNTSYRQKELKDTIKEIDADVAKVEFVLTTNKPTKGTGKRTTAIALGWPELAKDTDLAALEDGAYPSINEIEEIDIISKATVQRSGNSVAYEALAAGQVEPTAVTSFGNDAIAEAWYEASGKEATDTMKSATNDYHIGVWYAALTGLDPQETYYLVREYLDGSDNVLAVDWGTYSDKTEKFVFSSWGMNLQDTDYHQRELKDTIAEITSDVAKVRFTLTTTKPTKGNGSRKTAIELGWPKMAKETDLADMDDGVYASISEIAKEDIISQTTVERSGIPEEYKNLIVGQVEPTSNTRTGNDAIADAWYEASGKEATDTMKSATNDYHIGVWYAALTGLDSKKTYYLVREYLDDSDNVLAVDWGTYSGKTEKFVFSSWGMNLQDASYHQRELKDTIAEITKDAAKVRFTLTTAKPKVQVGNNLKTAIALGWPEIAEGVELANETYEVYPSIEAIAAADIINQATVVRSGSTVAYGSLEGALSVGQVEPTATTAIGNEAIADAWYEASGKEASGSMVADNNDYHIGVWYASLTGLDSAKTYYLVREYLDGSGNVLAVDWGEYKNATEKFVFSSWGMNLQDKFYHQRELNDTIAEIGTNAEKVRFTLTETKPTGLVGRRNLTTAIKLGWPNLAEGTELANETYEVYPSISAIAEKNILSQDIVSRSGSTIPYTYKVTFNGNGGTLTGGSDRYEQEFTYDEAKKLDANQFTRKGYDFFGWSTAPDGPVAYMDVETVINAVKEADNLNLYAIWVVWSPKKPIWISEWKWAKDYSYATLTLTDYYEKDKEQKEHLLQIDVAAVSAITGNRKTYYVEYTFDGVKFEDSKTFLIKSGSEVEITKDAFDYEGVDPDGYTYTGKQIKIDTLKVYWGESILVEGTDYSLKYANNVNAGKATVTVIGKGQYDKAFTEAIEFTINKADIRTDEFSADNIVIFDNAKVPAPKLLRGKSTINNKNNKVYNVTLKGEGKSSADVGQKAAVGKYTGTITPLETSNYTGEREFILTVIPKATALPASKLSVKFDKLTAITPDQVENGYIPKFTISSGKEKIRSDAEAFNNMFTVAYLNNKRAGTATVIITADDDYFNGTEGRTFNGKTIVGSVKKTFKIPGTKFSKAQKAELNAIKNKVVPYTGYAYNLDDVLDALDVDEYAPHLDRGEDFSESGDYYVSAYAKNIKKGTMTITFAGCGIYTGTLKVPVKIAAYTDYEVSFDGFADYEDGEANEVPYKAGGTVVTGLVVRALDGSYFLRQGVDYTVSYENNKMLKTNPKNKKGFAQLVIKGKGNYGTKKIPFTVVPNEIDDISLYVVPTEIQSSKLSATVSKIEKGKIKPAVYDAVTGKKLTAGKDFTFEFDVPDNLEDVTEIPEIPVTIKPGPNGTYGEKDSEFTFVGVHVYGTKLVGSGKKANVAINPNTKFFYKGKAITLDYEDFVDTAGFAKYGEDFEIIGYKNNIKAGTASVTIKAIGNTYGGTTTLKFKIQKANKKTVPQP